MSVDSQQFLLQALTSLLGGILGVTAGAWFTGLYKIKGEITARAEQIDTILAEVRSTAKATELSKISARAEGISSIIDEVARSTKASESTKIATRLEQLDQILPEVRAVTETQKRIETTVAGGEWDRQWRLNQMRDAYGRLLAAVYGLQDYFNFAGDIDWNSDQAASPEAQEAYSLYRKNAAEFKTAAALTRIFAGTPATLALDEYERRLKARANAPHSTRSGQAFQDLANLHYKLIDAAKADLGVYAS